MGQLRNIYHFQKTDKGIGCGSINFEPSDDSDMLFPFSYYDLEKEKTRCLSKIMA